MAPDGKGSIRIDAKWAIRLEVDEPNAVVAVGVSTDGDELGIASGGVPRDEDPPADWELYAINTVSDAHGTGLADELLDRAVGDRDNLVWVLIDNARARAFYSRHGYVADGETKVH